MTIVFLTHNPQSLLVLLLRQGHNLQLQYDCPEHCDQAHAVVIGEDVGHPVQTKSDASVYFLQFSAKIFLNNC